MKDRLQNKGLVLALATLCCLLWGSAYPAVKIGYVLFDIDTTGAQVLFAGYRFSLAGIITWLITSLYYPGFRVTGSAGRKNTAFPVFFLSLPSLIH